MILAELLLFGSPQIQVAPGYNACINARRARATAFPVSGREGGLSEPRARLVKYNAPLPG